MSETIEQRSPIKNLPVRAPGESLRKQISDHFDDQIMIYFLAVMGTGTMAIHAWLVYVTKQVHPWVMTALFAIACGALMVRLRLSFRTLRNLKRGMVGEQAVGQYLEESLRPHGYQVLHDIPGQGFNLDHVVVGPNGVFCIETKTRTKPRRGSPTIKFDGQTVTVGGCIPERDPVIQVKAGSSWLQELLKSSTGKTFSIRPVILFPGWFVDRMPQGADVWVLNEKALPTFIANARERLASDDIALITFHLKRCILAETQAEQARK